MSKLTVESLSLHHIGPISLTLEAGQCCAILGASGTGKTLLLRAIADLEPHQGRVFLDDIDCEQIPPQDWRRQVGMLAAKIMWWHDCVNEHFPSVNIDWLIRLGLNADILHSPVQRLSNGEQQRLALLRLLANQPKVLLLDEPTSNLDKHNTLCMEKLLTEYQRDHNAAVIWVSHDVEQAKRVAQLCYVMENGQLQSRATP